MFNKIKNWFKNLFKKETEVQPVPIGSVEEEPTPVEPIPIPDMANPFPNLITSQSGIELIKKKEGLHDYNKTTQLVHPYIDPVGIPTIGWGTITYEDGTPVKMSDTPIAVERAEYLLKFELDEKENVLVEHFKNVGFNYNQNEFDALMSFTYNLGIGVTTSANNTIGSAIRRGDKQAIANAFGLYVKGRVCKWGICRMKTFAGLVTRRREEKELFLKEV